MSAIQIMQPAATTVVVDAESAGQRLDNFLLRHLKGVPKTHIYRIIRSGEVRINKGRVAADTRVQSGDVVRLPPLRLAVRLPLQMDAANVTLPLLPVLLEDDALIAIHKPAGLAVHGGSGVSLGVIEQLRLVRPQAAFLELVHRLDRETSGVLLVAKKRNVLKHLQQQFKEHETQKRYLALVAGRWPAKQKVIDSPLHKYLVPGANGTEERRVKVAAVGDPMGKRSVTLVQVQALLTAAPALKVPDGVFSLLDITLKTGRTHQIRVHLSSEGHPIVGDSKYGNFELNKALRRTSTAPHALQRMFLHASSLRFTHPSTGLVVDLHADLPPELSGFLEALEGFCS